MSTLPFPGPTPLPLVGSLPAMSRDVLAFLTDNSRRYGDRVGWVAPGETIVQLTHPDDIEAVLIHQRDHTEKDPVTRSLDFLLGQGLLTAEGETWRRHRRIAAPFFTPRHLRAYAEAMTRSAVEDLPGPGEMDVHAWTSRVTLHIVLRTLFGMEPGGLADEVAPLVAALMEDFDAEYHSAARLLPEWVPLPHRQRLYGMAERLDAVLRHLVAQRRRGPDGPDLLMRLIRARTDDGEGLTDTEVRDEALTLFLAGHETTSLALSYTLWLLALHPAAQEAVVRELREVVGDRTATVDDLRALPTLDATVSESMRLYPPAWTIGRLAVAPLDLPGGAEIPEGTHILMPQWVVHRDGRWFRDPLSFRPERWRNGETDDLPRFAFFPFGGGPRVCIGNHFARMEAALVLAEVLPRLRFDPVPGYRPHLLPSVTLRARNGVHLRVSRRTARSADRPPATAHPAPPG